MNYFEPDNGGDPRWDVLMKLSDADNVFIDGIRKKFAAAFPTDENGKKKQVCFSSTAHYKWDLQ